MNTSRTTLGWIIGAAILVATSSIADAAVSMRVNRVGLFAGAPQCVRDGVMTFVGVDIRNTDAAPFDGLIRVTQTDRDGDVVVSELSVAVAPDGEWESKEIYFVPNMRNGDSRLEIKLYSADGELVEFTDDLGQAVKSIQSEAYYDRPDKEDLLIVTIASGGRVPHGRYLEFAAQAHDFSETITGRDIRGLAPRELPHKAQGLDAVDAIIWEDADPSDLTADQAQALRGWVEQGGRLLIAVSAHWQSFNASPLAEFLPASVDQIEDVNAIPAMKDIVVTLSDYRDLARKYRAKPVTRCRMRAAKDAIPIPSTVRKDEDVEDQEAAQDLEPIAYRGYVGRGMVTLLGARLSDLLPGPDVEDFDESDAARKKREAYADVVERVVANNFLAIPAFREAAGSVWGIEQRRNIFGALTSTIGFSAVTGVFLFFAIAFTGVYTLGATLGSYFYLNKKGWSGQCWPAFTAVSIVGVVIGLGMVWMLRGFSTKVWQTSVIDARAGAIYGYGTCLFGVKTKDHTRLDLQLPVGYSNTPGGKGILFALPTMSDPMTGEETSFVASESYTLTDDGTHIEGVPVRATLKEFEGRWHGELSGTLEARLVIDRFGRITKDSFIRNELGVVLRDCYLIEGNQEIAGENGRATGLRCHPIDRLNAAGELASLDGERLVARIYDDRKAAPNADGTPAQRKGVDLLLSTYLESWKNTGSFGSFMGPGAATPNVRADAEITPFLLLSLYNLIPPGASQNEFWNLRRSYGRRLDCSHWITKRTAVLIGFSYEKPPAVLQIDRANERPEKSLTMYRFLIPVERE
ncbi:MAG TPA: hypothetical protein P5081_00515 [Phycisphaerae bacterium]|nr:hypothetical protein [Phycisphaerae bacterium]HRW51336.1 hypothetical protein [Phycisphaerae bacterium]